MSKGEMVFVEAGMRTDEQGHAMDDGAARVERAKLAERLRSLYERFNYVQKAGTNSHFKYRFVREADLKVKLNQAMRDLDFSLSSVFVDYVGNEKAGVATVTLRIKDSRSGQDVLELQGVAGGVDSSDKAPQKAMVGAFKYALTSGFAVATGDDPEADGKADEDALEELLAELGRAPTTAAVIALKPRVATFREGARWDELRAAYQAAVARCGGAASDDGGKS
jgi:hypothetical protein